MLLEEWDVCVGTDFSNLHLFKLPSRNHLERFLDGSATEVKYKPVAGVLEATLPFDTKDVTFDGERAKCMAGDGEEMLNGLILKGTSKTCDKGLLCMATLNAEGELILS